MNEMRVACIRLLRQELGPQFQGGLVHSPYAREHYSDCLLADEAEGSQWQFMRMVKEVDVCIATTGLHGSNGFSLGEYVAASKAIVSQELRYTVPDFREDTNYLAFSTPEACVSKTLELMRDRARLQEMKVANYAYYHRSLRPDRLVLNALLLALDENGGPPFASSRAGH